MPDLIDPLIEWCHAPRAVWAETARPTFTEALRARYPLRDWGVEDRKTRPIQLRVNANLEEKNAPYAGVIGPDQETSKGYGGMSFVVFPGDRDGQPAMFGLVVGTNGLAPDEAILGRPGHARRVRAIVRWLNATAPAGAWAWAKHDPVRIDLPLPSSVAARMDPWCNAREKYGAVCYALVRPPADAAEHRGWVRRAFLALLDLAMEERRLVPKKGGGGLGTLRAEGREVELVLMAVRLDGELGELGRRVEGLVRGGQGAGLG
jgi:5-methylcytosine-specific restriction protein B